MTKEFPTSYTEILQRIDSIDPIAYGQTRNFINGAVSRLSSYISRGVISPVDIIKRLQPKFSFSQMMKLYQQLAWREFFQRVWQEQQDNILSDLRPSAFRHPLRPGVPSSLINANTGISAIDQMLGDFYSTGYLHNHARLYIASLAANIGRADWLAGARWMYYHLLDGDLASNMLSWQWVAGTFSTKPYLFNQENLDHYSGTSQRGTFIDVPYDALPSLSVPRSLQEVQELSLHTTLPVTALPTIDSTLPTLVYNSYNLDPNWRSEGNYNRILLLEPDHFIRYPVSEQVLNFVHALAENIPGLQIFVASFEDLDSISSPIIYREHPSAKHYRGTGDDRSWLFPAAKGPFTSFSKYWNQLVKKQPLGNL